MRSFGTLSENIFLILRCSCHSFNVSFDIDSLKSFLTLSQWEFSCSKIKYIFFDALCDIYYYKLELFFNHLKDVLINQFFSQVNKYQSVLLAALVLVTAWQDNLILKFYLIDLRCLYPFYNLTFSFHAGTGCKSSRFDLISSRAKFSCCWRGIVQSIICL